MSCEQCGKDKYSDDQNYCTRCGSIFERVGECPICFETTKLRVLPCGHTVCDAKCSANCIEKCPLCRVYFKDTKTTTINICNHCYSKQLINVGGSNISKCKNCDQECTPFPIEYQKYNTGSFIVKQRSKVNTIWWVCCKKCRGADFQWSLKGQHKCPRCKVDIHDIDVIIRHNRCDDIPIV